MQKQREVRERGHLQYGLGLQPLNSRLAQHNPRFAETKRVQTSQGQVLLRRFARVPALSLCGPTVVVVDAFAFDFHGNFGVTLGGKSCPRQWETFFSLFNYTKATREVIRQESFPLFFIIIFK